jgi:hypothetical protein
MRRLILATLAVLSLSACETTGPKPVGIGTGVDELRRSPCVKASTSARPCAPVLQQWGRDV